MRLRGEKRRRIGMAIVCLLCVAGICFSIRFFPWCLSALRTKGAEGAYAERTAAFIWKQWYPACETVGGSTVERFKSEEGSGGWLVKFITRQVPYYKLLEGQQDDRAWQDPDPAFGDYMQSRQVFEEYEYLVKGLAESAVLSSGNNPLIPENMAGGQAADSKDTGQLVLNNPAGENLLDQKNAALTGTQYIEAQLADYDFLMKHFYTVHPTAAADREMMKADQFLVKDFSLTKTSDEPQILIYHTHSQEEFADYGTNKEATIVGVGDYLTELLQQKGYNVIHDTSVYDLRDGKLDRSKAYTYALDGIAGILQKYPSIEVVLDVHRDGVKSGTHLVQEVNGKETATIMFFNGTSQTPTGPIEYLQNPYREENLAFSFQMKLFAEAYYPGFTRKIYLKGLRYNMHLRPRSALIEVGAQTNTYAEAKNAMEPLSELLDSVLRPR